jgi:hypothetical protein
MKKISCTLVLFFAVLSQTLACACGGSDKEMFEKADYVIIGTAIVNPDLDSRWDEFSDTPGKGSNVLLQVESVIKGDVNVKEKIFIYQFQSSCTQVFHFGKKYLIFGEKIEKFTQGNHSSQNGGALSPPPPPPSVDCGIVELYTDKKKVNLLNNQVAKYKTIKTDMCTSLSTDSNGFATIMTYLKTINN